MLWWTTPTYAAEGEIPAEVPAPSEAAPSLTDPILLAPPVVAWPIGADPALGPQIVALLLRVETDGAVGAVSVEGPEGEVADPFAAEAVRIAAGLRFSPATEGGQPVAVEVPLRIEFLPPGADPGGDPEGDPRGDPGGDPDPGVVGAWRRDGRGRVVTAGEARRLPGTLNDPARAVQDLPGSVRAPLGSGWLLVRGGNARDTTIHVDGVPALSLQHFGGLSGVIHPGWLEGAEFWPGSAPAAYDSGTAGTVALTTAPLLADPSPRAVIGADVAQAGALWAGPVGAGSPGSVAVGAAARRSWLDQALGLVAATPEGLQAAPTFRDAQARAEIGRVSVFGYGFSDGLVGSFMTGEPVELRLASARLQAARAPGSGGVSASAAAGFDRAEVQGVADPTDLRRDDAWTLQARVSGGGALGAARWGAGLDPTMELRRVQAGEISRRLPAFAPEGWAEIAGAGGAGWRAGARAEPLLVPGQLPRFGFSPRASGGLWLAPGLEGFLTAGLQHQAPPGDLMVGLPEGSLLALERAWSGSAGLRAAGDRGGAALSGGLEGWARRLERVTQFEADGSLGQGQGWAWGLEAEGRAEAARWQGALIYQFSRSFRQEDPGDPWAYAPFEQPHALTALLLWLPADRWSLAARFRYSAGLPRPEGDLRIYDPLRGEEAWLVEEGDRMPAFHALDVRAVRSFDLGGRGGQIEVSLDLQNAYDRRIAEPVLTPLSEVYPVWVVGLPVLPLLGVEWWPCRG